MFTLTFKKLAISLAFLPAFLTVSSKPIISQNQTQIHISQSQDTSQYIGWRYSYQKNNFLLKNLRHAAIGTAKLVLSEYNSPYDISGWLDTKNDRLIVFFAQRIGSNRQSKTTWEVIDALSLSLNEFDLSTSYAVDLGDSWRFKSYRSGKYELVGDCFLNNRRDTEIMAIIKFDPHAEYYRDIKKVWRVNRKTQKFAEISTRGISCRNPYPI